MMIKKYILISLSSLWIITLNVAAEVKTNNEVISLISEVANKSSLEDHLTSQPAEQLIKEINLKDPFLFSENELLGFISSALSLNIPVEMQDKAKELKQQQEYLINKFKNYRVSGMCFAIDPNLAFVFERQNPDIDVVFKDCNGNVKLRKFKVKINTVGFKLEASIKLDFIFFVNTDLNFYDSDKVIELGVGIDSNLIFGLALTYAPFVNFPGGILIISIPLFLVFPSLSLVTGGSLTPII